MRVNTLSALTCTTTYKSPDGAAAPTGLALTGEGGYAGRPPPLGIRTLMVRARTVTPLPAQSVHGSSIRDPVPWQSWQGSLETERALVAADIARTIARCTYLWAGAGFARRCRGTTCTATDWSPAAVPWYRPRRRRRSASSRFRGLCRVAAARSTAPGRLG